MGIKGKSSMGMKKHGKSGWKNGAGKSPKARYMARMEAERNEIKARPSTCKHSSVADLFSGEQL